LNRLPTTDDSRPIASQRPRIITVLSLSHAALALAFLFGIVNLSIIIAQEKDTEAIRGLLIGMAACGVFAFASVVAALGFWLETRWTRPLAVASLATIVFGCTIGFFNEGDWEWDLLPWLIMFLALLLVHFLPAVSRRLKPQSIRSKESIEVL
jgi:hypothetical protein